MGALQTRDPPAVPHSWAVAEAAQAEAVLPRGVRRACAQLAHERAMAYEAELRQALLRAAWRHSRGRSHWLLGEPGPVERAAREVLAAV